MNSVDTNPTAAARPFRIKDCALAALATGRKVRLQFDGWPALQFSGWPAVAVGTFGGEIAVIDPVAGPDGRYRVTPALRQRAAGG